MKRASSFNVKIFLSLSIFLLLITCPQGILAQEGGGAGSADDAQPLFGVWENSTRFVEITANGRMRVILKPYYAFVYEDEGFVSCSIKEERAFEGGGIYTLSVAYPGERGRQALPAAVLEGNSLYTGFYIKEENDAPPAQADEAAMEAALSGFWIYRGGAGGIRLYASPAAEDFFCLYFDGARYYRIRYWLTDARFRQVRAVFLADDGERELSVPKFLQSGDCLYTCVKGTGVRLRNYESGTWEYADGAISFFAEKQVFEGKHKLESSTIEFAADGAVLFLGEPQLVLSSVSDIDAEIEAHNSHRRPQRKPPLDFMDLDFRWDEIEN